MWAKSNDDGRSLPLYVHLADTAAVAALLWDEWLPRHVKNTLATDLRGDLGRAKRRLEFLAAAHDLGKCTPAFGVQVPELCAVMRDYGFPFRVRRYDPDRTTLPHSLAGYFILERWLVDGTGWDRETARSYAVVVGSHHGITPTRADVRQSPPPHLIGEGDVWRDVQQELIEYVVGLAGVRTDLSEWMKRPIPVRAQVLLTAVVIVADWLASDETRFPYGEPESSRARAARAWRELRLTPAWTAVMPVEEADCFIRRRFNLPTLALARPVQRCAIEVARSMRCPGLMVIEAPMGEGKTEAAMAAAEILAARFGFGGCFVALPTMATSDAMFARVEAWIENLPRNPNVADPQTLFLAHSKASLNQDFSDLVRVHDLAGIGDDQGGRDLPDEVLVAHSWLTGRKKGPLSNFVVGTIDQILFASLKSRHLMLRHLALVNKVVIIDEVHSFDSYMNVYLDRALGWLGKYGVPVIMLSATLPSSRRRALIAAYEHGADSRIQRGSAHGSVAEMAAEKRRMREQRRSATPIDPYPILHGDIGYPVVTSADRSHLDVTPVSGSTRRQSVTIKGLADDAVTLISALESAIGEGGCAAVIRNTVARAQATFELLRRHFGRDVRIFLAHSRFVASDRMELEATLRSTFGPPGGAVQRPSKAIVVGTQVLEQSLDVDFDVMVTDLAPMDLLVQRIGRLHRHERGSRPPGVASAVCFVAGVDDWAAPLPAAVHASTQIYGSYLLLSTLAVLRQIFDKGGRIELPVDIPRLVEQAYEDPSVIPESWRDDVDIARCNWELELATKRSRARSFLLGPAVADGGSIIDWVSRGVGEADDSADGQAQVRDAEDSVEVVVVCRVDGELRTLPHLARHRDHFVPEDSAPDDAVARAVVNSSIRLPYSLCTPWRIDAVVGGLEKNAFAGWQQSRWLKGQLALVLDAELKTTLAGAVVRYDKEVGLTVTYAQDSDRG